MAKPELGTKRIDPETGKKFYDLNKDPVVSPYTGKSYPLSFFAETSVAAILEKATEEEEVQEVDPLSAPVCRVPHLVRPRNAARVAIGPILDGHLRIGMRRGRDVGASELADCRPPLRQEWWRGGGFAADAFVHPRLRAAHEPSEIVSELVHRPCSAQRGIPRRWPIDERLRLPSQRTHDFLKCEVLKSIAKIRVVIDRDDADAGNAHQ